MKMTTNFKGIECDVHVHKEINFVHIVSQFQCFQFLCNFHRNSVP